MFYSKTKGIKAGGNNNFLSVTKAIINTTKPSANKQPAETCSAAFVRNLDLFVSNENPLSSLFLMQMGKSTVFAVVIVTTVIQIILLFVSVTYNWHTSLYPRSRDQQADGKKQKPIRSEQTKEKDFQRIPRLKLIVAILSAPNRVVRRNGIRMTWMNDCSRNDVLCRFFTDSPLQMNPIVKRELQDESIRYGDLEFMSVPPGINFGRRMLWLLQWSVANYNFDFFLRIDDDYFLCLRKLLAEVPYRVQIPK